MLRDDGTLNPLDDWPDLDAQTLEAVLAQVTTSVPKKLADFHETGELDVAYTGHDLPRFRVNGFRQRRARRRSSRSPRRTDGADARAPRAPPSARPSRSDVGHEHRRLDPHRDYGDHGVTTGGCSGSTMLNSGGAGADRT